VFLFLYRKYYIYIELVDEDVFAEVGCEVVEVVAVKGVVTEITQHQGLSHILL